MSNVNLPRVSIGASRRATSGMRLLVVLAAAVLLGAMLHVRAGAEPPDYPGAMNEEDAAAAPMHAAR